MIRHQIARILSALADRIEPEPQRMFYAATPMTEKTAHALADLVSGYIVGQGVAGRGFTAGSGDTARY